jgi:hypothetical protein
VLDLKLTAALGQLGRELQIQEAHQESNVSGLALKSEVAVGRSQGDGE